MSAISVSYYQILGMVSILFTLLSDNPFPLSYNEGGTHGSDYPFERLLGAQKTCAMLRINPQPI
jgi:hypothetical protein